MSEIRGRGRRGGTIVPNWRLEDPDLDPFELRIAAWLSSHADGWVGDHVTRNLIAARLNISQGKVTSAMDRLVALGIVELSTIAVPQSEGGKRWDVIFDFDVWEREPWSPHDQAPVTTRPGPGHVVTTSSEVVQEEEQESPDAVSGVPVYDDEEQEPTEAIELCQGLARSIHSRGSKMPNITRGWVSDMEKLLRIDGHTVDEVRDMIIWLHHGKTQSAAFWQTNIRSPKKLRVHFDRMREQRANEAARLRRGGDRSASIDFDKLRAEVTQ